MLFNFEKDSCLLVIDIQEDNRSVYNYKIVKKNIIKLIDKARNDNVPIIYIFLEINSKSNWVSFKKELIGEVKEEGKFLEFIKPKKNEEIVVKSSYDSFFQTNLDKILKKKKTKNIYLCGFLTGICVLNTAFTASHLGYRVFLIKNCCSDKSKKRHLNVFQNYSNYLFITENID